MIQEIRSFFCTRFCRVCIELISSQLEVLMAGGMLSDPFWMVFITSLQHGAMLPLGHYLSSYIFVTEKNDLR
jgi:hypothetical protein